MYSIIMERLHINDYAWVFYIQTTPDQLQIINEDLQKFYPAGHNKFDLYNYLKDHSCEYCLEYGHKSPTVVDPFKCPKVPATFPIMIEEIARKHKVSKDSVAYWALKKRSRYIHYPGRFPNDVWTWQMLEDKIKEDKKSKASKGKIFKRAKL